MIHKKRTCLLSAKTGTDSSNYVNHYSLWPSSFICDNNENGFMKGNQPESFYWNSCRFGEGRNRKYYNLIRIETEMLSTCPLFTKGAIASKAYLSHFLKIIPYITYTTIPTVTIPFIQLMGLDATISTLTLTKKGQYSFQDVYDFSYPRSLSQIKNGDIQNIIKGMTLLKNIISNQFTMMAKLIIPTK